MAENRVIGRGNRLPWHLPADLAHFKRLTLDKPIVMGRRTWESLPGLLPRRRHIVVTANAGYRAEGALVVTSLEAAVEAATGEPELMVVGGAQLYRSVLPMARRLYLTLVHAAVEGDTVFPEWDPACWRETTRTEHPGDERNAYSLSFLTFERIREDA
jgi:dihydrofolate reductase